MDCQSKLVKVVPTFYDEALLVSFSKEILKFNTRKAQKYQISLTLVDWNAMQCIYWVQPVDAFINHKHSFLILIQSIFQNPNHQ